LSRECQWCGTYGGVQAVRVNGIVNTYLCFRCWGIYKETGERPPRYRMRDPQAGPITGRPLRLG
jgi:hypothetical protein